MTFRSIPICTALLIVLIVGLPAQQTNPPTPEASVPPTEPSTGQPNPKQPINGQSVTEKASSEQSPEESSSEASHVRIVRLSQVTGSKQGEILVDRNTGRGFENALVNLPITEGTKLRTGDGLAEVEFEDNSSLRVTPRTLIEFSQLRLPPSGATVSTVNVVEGNVYVSLEKTADTQFTVTFGQENITLMPSTHMRLNIRPKFKRLVVYSGSVRVEGPSGVTVVDKKKMLTFDPAGENPPVMAKDTLQSRFDDWDREAVKFHELTSGAQGLPYLFGVSDLRYYGAFADSGCGLMWSPYLTSTAWDPYMNGYWVWYPGSGYTWVSAYPWGWMPYHFGDWVQCGPSWGWLPRSGWVGLHNPPRRPHPPLPPRPPKPVVPANATIVAANRRPLMFSGLNRLGKFVFRNDSAGTGIPRSWFKNLANISNHVQRQGTFVAPLPAKVQAEARAAAAVAGSQHGTIAGKRAARPGGSARGSSGDSFGSSVAHTSSMGGRSAAPSGASARK
jgi:hypothetical protein